jgi:hypothetical protein
MTKSINLPIEGKAIRFGPSRDQEPAASLWKIWVEGNEVYASTRNFGGTAKVSVHASGQVHYRLEKKLKQDLAPVMQLGSGPWRHAFELRFLLSDGAHSPFGERESLKNKSAYLIPVPDGFLLYANLIIGSKGTPFDCPLPSEFLPAGQTLWRSRLRDGRPAVLVTRLLELDDQNREHIRYLREELKPTVTSSTTPTGSKYIELLHLHWSPGGGNVILAVPMGEEAFRSEQEIVPSGALPLAPRHFRYRSFRSTVDLFAPDGQRVATIELAEVDKQVALVKGQPSEIEIGTVNMLREPTKLISGSKFIASPRKLISTPNLGGASPRNWEYIIHAAFDGSCLSVEFRQNSASLQNRNSAAPISQLDNGEEIMMTIPAPTVKLSSTLDVPFTSAAFVGRFTLRDWR